MFMEYFENMFRQETPFLERQKSRTVSQQQRVLGSDGYFLGRDHGLLEIPFTTAIPLTVLPTTPSSCSCRITVDSLPTLAATTESRRLPLDRPVHEHG